MKNVFLGFALLAGLSSATAFAAGDAAKGKVKSAMCAGCHGATGKSLVELYPNLAGQKATYLVNQLKAFKSGVRKNATMKAMSAALTDADMANIAAFYASQK